MMRTRKDLIIAAAAFGWILTAVNFASADHSVGDEATLFQTVNEEMEPVDMTDMIDGKPLVLVVSSAS